MELAELMAEPENEEDATGDGGTASAGLAKSLESTGHSQQPKRKLEFVKEEDGRSSKRSTPICPGCRRPERLKDNLKSPSGKPVCQGCHMLYKEQQYCRICERCWMEYDLDEDYVECGHCRFWVHARCASLSDAAFKKLNDFDESLEFCCMDCEKDYKMVSEEMSAHGKDDDEAPPLKALPKKAPAKKAPAKKAPAKKAPAKKAPAKKASAKKTPGKEADDASGDGEKGSRKLTEDVDGVSPRQARALARSETTISVLPSPHQARKKARSEPANSTSTTPQQAPAQVGSEQANGALESSDQLKSEEPPAGPSAEAGNASAIHSPTRKRSRLNYAKINRGDGVFTAEKTTKQKNGTRKAGAAVEKSGVDAKPAAKSTAKPAAKTEASAPKPEAPTPKAEAPRIKAEWLLLLMDVYSWTLSVRAFGDAPPLKAHTRARCASILSGKQTLPSVIIELFSTANDSSITCSRERCKSVKKVIKTIKKTCKILSAMDYERPKILTRSVLRVAAGEMPAPRQVEDTKADHTRWFDEEIKRQLEVASSKGVVSDEELAKMLKSVEDSQFKRLVANSRNENRTHC